MRTAPRNTSMLVALVAALLAASCADVTQDIAEPQPQPLVEIVDSPAPLDLAACLALEPGRSWEVAVPDRPNKRRTLEVAEVPVSSAVGAVTKLNEAGCKLVRLSVIKGDERKDILFATRGDEAWLVGLDVDATPSPLWFEPFVPVYGPDIRPDDEPRTTDVIGVGRATIDAGLFETEVDVEIDGDITVTWTPSEDGQRRATLTLGFALEAEATIAGLPVTKEVDESLTGLLDETTGWVKLIDPKRTYVVVDAER